MECPTCGIFFDDLTQEDIDIQGACYYCIICEDCDTIIEPGEGFCDNCNRKD